MKVVKFVQVYEWRFCYSDLTTVFFTEALTLFRVAKIDDTMKKTILRYFTIILSYSCYFVISWIYDLKHCTCNLVEFE